MIVDERYETTILNALAVAKERYQENAQTMRDLEAQGGTGGSTPWITKDGARQMAEQFESQADEVGKVANLILGDEDDVS